jgi:hypothetical protein
MRNTALPLVILLGLARGLIWNWEDLASTKEIRNISAYSPFNYLDTYFNSSLSCFNCIQNDYLYCRQGTQEQLTLTSTSTAPPEVCCKNYLDCPPLYKMDWICSTNYDDKMLALRMCPQKQSKCGKNNSLLFNKASESATINMTLDPGDVCLFNIRSTCGIPTLEFETNQDWKNLEIYTLDFDDNDLESTDFSVKPSETSAAVLSAKV